jgi:signal transduction histidine kinase/ActR/RegA family two-component response regulator
MLGLAGVPPVWRARVTIQLLGCNFRFSGTGGALAPRAMEPQVTEMLRFRPRVLRNPVDDGCMASPMGSEACAPGGPGSGLNLPALVDHRESVRADQTVDQVYGILRDQPHAFAAVVDGGKYQGLVSRGHLGILLGTRFGFALHSGHLIRDHLLPDCLIASESMLLLDLLRRALARTGETFYQDVPLLDDDGRYLGIITVPTLVRAQSALIAEQFRLVEEQQRELVTKNEDLFRNLHELRQSQGRYETLFQNSPLPVALLYADGRIDTQNQRCLAMLGSGSPCAGTLPNLAERVPPKQREAFLELLRLHESGVAPLPGQADEFHLHLPPGGERLFKFHTSLVRETGQICTVLQDITEQRTVERRMALNDKTALFESLAGGIAHELNNALSPVLGYAELLDMRLGSSGDHAVLKSYCGAITKSAQDSVRIIRQLLQLSRPATTEFRQVDLGAVLDEAVSIMRFRLRASEARLTLTVAEGARILADAGQIKQVLINLLINALDAMEHATRKELRVRVEVVDSRVELSVADTGHGIPPEKLGRIFDPFYSTKSAERGTGLGLSVCLGIVGQHRGEISVNSVPGEGTVFKVLLPLARGGEAEAEAPLKVGREPAPAVAAGFPGVPPHLEVLVIDDEKYITSLVHELLRSRLGWRVEQVHDGREAIQRLEHGRFDLVITDLRMPGLDGFAILGWIKDFRPALLARMLVITGDSGGLSQDQELRALGIPVLKKPFTSEELVARCLEQTSLAAPVIERRPAG